MSESENIPPLRDGTLWSALTKLAGTLRSDENAIAELRSDMPAIRILNPQQLKQFALLPAIACEKLAELYNSGEEKLPTTLDELCFALYTEYQVQAMNFATDGSEARKFAVATIPQMRGRMHALAQDILEETLSIIDKVNKHDWEEYVRAHYGNTEKPDVLEPSKLIVGGKSIKGFLDVLETSAKEIDSKAIAAAEELMETFPDIANRTDKETVASFYATVAIAIRDYIEHIDRAYGGKAILFWRDVLEDTPQFIKNVRDGWIKENPMLADIAQRGDVEFHAFFKEALEQSWNVATEKSSSRSH